MQALIYNRVAGLAERAGQQPPDDTDYYAGMDDATFCARDGDQIAFEVDLTLGFLHDYDLNRIDEWTAYLTGRLAGHGYGVSADCKTDWTRKDLPTPVDFARMRRNIDGLQDGFYPVPDWRPLHPVRREDGVESTDYNQLNAKEWDLHQLDFYIGNMEKAFYFSGELWSGEV